MYESFFACPVIDFSNVTEYFERNYSESRAYESLSKSFNQAPPFACFWMESKARSIHPELRTYGVFVRTIDFEQVSDKMKTIRLKSNQNGYCSVTSSMKWLPLTLTGR